MSHRIAQPVAEKSEATVPFDNGVLHSLGTSFLWIDTDIALHSPFRDPDDAFALAAIAGSPEIYVAGVSTSFGNGPLPLVEKSARELVERLPRRNGFALDRIFSGASSPAAIAQTSAATEALAAALRKQPLTYLALAPLTNLAAFLQIHPELESRIERIIFLGGQTLPGKIPLPPFCIHDANVCKDPGAARRILRSQIPLLLVPATVAGRLRLNPRDFREFGAGLKFLRRKTVAWRFFWQVFANGNGAPVFDALAALAAADLSLLQMENCSASMNDRDELIIHSSVQDFAGRSVAYCSSFDVAAAKRALIRCLSRSAHS
jgi:inosine-uridine nucleoside N-ribohydrolase